MVNSAYVKLGCLACTGSSNQFVIGSCLPCDDCLLINHQQHEAVEQHITTHHLQFCHVPVALAAMALNGVRKVSMAPMSRWLPRGTLWGFPSANHCTVLYLIAATAHTWMSARPRGSGTTRL